MQVNRLLISCKILVLFLIFLLSCRKDEKIKLSLDISKAPDWNYLFSVDIKSIIGKDSSATSYKSSLRTYLKYYNLDRNGTANFKLSAPHITSDFLGEQEIGNLERQFETVVLKLKTKEVAVDTEDSLDMPVSMAGEWNLSRNFLKVLPAFPERPVAVGERWERERQFPLESNHGKAVGHLYQLFTLDSISSVKGISRKAYLDWLFKYQIELVSSDSTDLDKLPLNGSGCGTTVIDLANNTIEVAHAVFETQSEPSSGIGWMETVHLEMLK